MAAAPRKTTNWAFLARLFAVVFGGEALVFASTYWLAALPLPGIGLAMVLFLFAVLYFGRAALAKRPSAFFWQLLCFAVLFSCGLAWLLVAVLSVAPPAAYALAFMYLVAFVYFGNLFASGSPEIGDDAIADDDASGDGELDTEL